jgi:hypothetical protein
MTQNRGNILIMDDRVAGVWKPMEKIHHCAHDDLSRSGIQYSVTG